LFVLAITPTVHVLVMGGIFSAGLDTKPFSSPIVNTILPVFFFKLFSVFNNIVYHYFVSFVPKVFPKFSKAEPFL
jgi:hypothetical protein